MKNEQKQVSWSFTLILMRKSMISPPVRKGEKSEIRSAYLVSLSWSILGVEWDFLQLSER